MTVKSKIGDRRSEILPDPHIASPFWIHRRAVAEKQSAVRERIAAYIVILFCVGLFVTGMMLAISAGKFVKQKPGTSEHREAQP